MKRFARGALTLAFWVAVWTALALLVNRELLLPAPWVVVRRLCELAATAAFWLTGRPRRYSGRSSCCAARG